MTGLLDMDRICTTYGYEWRDAYGRTLAIARIVPNMLHHVTVCMQGHPNTFPMHIRHADAHIARVLNAERAMDSVYAQREYPAFYGRWK